VDEDWLHDELVKATEAALTGVELLLFLRINFIQYIIKNDGISHVWMKKLLMLLFLIFID
jgi:hypothetical protein